jgi:hypothetical protein
MSKSRLDYSMTLIPLLLLLKIEGLKKYSQQLILRIDKIYYCQGGILKFEPIFHSKISTYQLFNLAIC